MLEIDFSGGDPISVSSVQSVQLFWRPQADADRGLSRLGFGVAMARVYSKCEYEFDEHTTFDAPHSNGQWLTSSRLVKTTELN